MDFRMDLRFHTLFLRLLARRMSPKFYIELGVNTGDTFTQVRYYCRFSVGVDINPDLYQGSRKNLALLPSPDPVNPEHDRFYGTTTQEFLKEHLPDLVKSHGHPELVFIDADHDFRAVMEDFGEVWKWIAPHGLVVIHDTFPEAKEHLSPKVCANSYVAAEYIQHYRGSFKCECLTLPVPPGLTLVKRPGPRIWEELGTRL
jgi:predicted O-methyltransferase YrrM